MRRHALRSRRNARPSHAPRIVTEHPLRPAGAGAPRRGAALGPGGPAPLLGRHQGPERAPVRSRHRPGHAVADARDGGLPRPARGRRPGGGLALRLPLARSRHGGDPTHRHARAGPARRTASTTGSPTGAGGSGPAACTIPRPRPRARSTGSIPTARADGWSTGSSSRTRSAGAPTGGPCTTPTPCAGPCGRGTRTPNGGEIANRRVFVTLSGDEGAPGRRDRRRRGIRVARALGRLAADARTIPTGRTERVVRLPVQRPTCPAFGGPDLDGAVRDLGDDRPLAGRARDPALGRRHPGSRPGRAWPARSALHRLRSAPF